MLKSKVVVDNTQRERSRAIIDVIGINKKVNLNLVGLDGNAHSNTTNKRYEAKSINL